MYNFLKNTRVIIFIIAFLVSVILIASPPGLQFGLDIAGGSWVQLKPQGAIASIEINSSAMIENLVEGVAGTVNILSITENEIIFTVEHRITQSQMDLLEIGPSEIFGNQVTLTTTNQFLISSYLRHNLDAEIEPIIGTDKFEIRTAISENELTELVNKVGGTVTEFEPGVTAGTRDLTKEILNHKINIIGVKEVPIRTVGEHYILIDFAGMNLSDARALVERPGRFEIRIQTTINESMHVLYGDAIESAEIPRDDRGVWSVDFRLNEIGAHSLRRVAIATGATENPENHELMMILDDEVIFSAPFAPDAAANLRDAPRVGWSATTGTGQIGEAKARELHMHLRAGALPVDVEILASGEVDARLGDQFKFQSILIGFLALITVALVVFMRYKRKEILVPMIGLEITEISMILGIMSMVGWQLDLPSIAGIIASIGTGIDHLIIVTDEVLYEGKIPTTKVYLSRISKAFGIIIAAVITTIVAMTPLVVMGFGALRGFAIIIILGMLIGILITRPVYGIIIKELLERKDASVAENS